MKTKENEGNIYKMMNAWLRNCRNILASMKKRTKDTSSERGWEENAWRAVFNSIFMNNKGPSHTFFFTTFGKKFIIQIIWNVILYHWHVSPAINYGKFLVLLFLKIFPAPTSFSFFIWFPPNDSLSENIKILTAPLHLMNSL